MVRVVFSSALAAAALAVTASAFTVSFDNKCSHEIDLYTREGGVYTDGQETIAVGGSCSKTLGKGFEGHFRHGESVAATLVEFATKGDYALAWYDISIIPPSLEAGWEYCSSLEECKEHSPYGVGYNVPVSVTPQSNTGKDTCEQLTCPEDGCTDAYLFPKDDGKTHSCAMDTDFVITFCPDGSASVASNSTSASVSDEGDYTQGSATAYGTEDYSESASEATETPEVTTATPVVTTATPVATTATPEVTTATPVATTATPSTEDAGTKKPKICDMSLGAIAPASSVLFVCDLQSVFRNAIYEVDTMMRGAVSLIEMAKILAVPVVVTTQNAARLGATAPEITTALQGHENVVEFDKMTFTMMTPQVESHMQQVLPSARSVILCGGETHVCVLQTCLDLLAKGYEVHVIADAVSSSTAFNRTLSLERMRQAGAFITSVESIIFQMTRDAAHPKFRSISKLIKQHLQSKNGFDTQARL